MNKITIKEVAKKCNVSVSTVSRAINNHPEINKDTRLKILEEIDRLGYTPNLNARNLKISTTNTIAVIIKGISNPFFNPMMKILEEDITKRGYSFLLYKAEDAENELDVAIKLLQDKKPKGIIFLGGFVINDTEKLKKLDIPFVMTTIINKGIQVDNSVYMGVDDIKESEKITDYLISLGHKKILILGGREDDCSISMLRIQGYKNALKKNKLSKNENIVTANFDVQPYTFAYGYDMAGRIIKDNVDFTAVFCISDAIAIGFMKRMREHNLFAPKDYSLVGFDGLELNEYIYPRITTIKQPVEEIAKKSCIELFKMINNQKYSEIVTFDGDLYIGDTTSNLREENI